MSPTAAHWTFIWTLKNSPDGSFSSRLFHHFTVFNWTTQSLARIYFCYKAHCFLSYPWMQKTKCRLLLCSSLLCIWKLLPCLCFIFSSTDCTEPISSIFHCRSCFLVLWSFSHWIIKALWKEKSIKIIVLVIIIIKINDSITMHFIWAIANLTFLLMFNNVYTDISFQTVLLC